LLTIDNLPGFNMLRPIPIIVEKFTSGNFVASCKAGNASGESESEAVENLKDIIISTFYLYATQSPEKLGKIPSQQLAYLKRCLQELPDSQSNQVLPNQILCLADGLKTLACSIKSDGYPPEAQRVCRIGAKIVTYYLQLKKQEIDKAVEMAMFHAGFKWTALKEENMRNEFWWSINSELEQGIQSKTPQTNDLPKINMSVPMPDVKPPKNKPKEILETQCDNCGRIISDDSDEITVYCMGGCQRTLCVRCIDGSETGDDGDTICRDCLRKRREY